MLRKSNVDFYFDHQPKATFPEELKKYCPLTIHRIENTDKNYVKVDNVYLDTGDFDKDKYLQTIFDDFNNFIKINGIKGTGFPVSLSLNSSCLVEEYNINITDNKIEIISGEREGVRRALVKLQDLLVTGGGNLLKGNKHYKMVLERRISRCFFSPINRPPLNREELGDDIDYYPDGYLTKLMHDGVNTIWICSEYSTLIHTEYIPEFGLDGERRFKKLNAVIEKCARYGISVFLFLIEPLSLQEPAIKSKFPDLFDKYPQSHGNKGAGPMAFCTYTDFGEKYLSECVRQLFTKAPRLGGIMSISYGERVTSCANTWGDSEGKWVNTCPHCHDKTQMEIVAHTVDIIVKAMKSVNPDAEYISWTYGQRGNPYSMIEEYVDKITPDAILMQNFEDDGRVMQLGKKRFALDYYLCYPGPSQMFDYTAKMAEKYNKKLYAKMQICCSHELATMPYIPAPGIVYDKIMGAKNINVKGVMESWFFGNYPCIMSKAVELLSYNIDYKNKKDFLWHLALLYWNKKDAEKVVSAWEYFEEAYTNYPVNVMFNYYGPMHDGIVWDLALLPRNFSLARTWLLMDRPDGDRIGECLFYGHTIDEAITLCETVVDNWEKGCEKLSEISAWNDDDNEQIAVSKGLKILFKSGLNILKFYKLRNDIGYNRGNVMDNLKDMKELVKKEMQNSLDMIPICTHHNCVGYHSEAEGFKFFPEKLKNRVKQLERLLDEDFTYVENRIKKGLIPLDYYDGVEEGIKSVKGGRNGLESGEWAFLDDNKTSFKVAENGDKIQIEIKSDIETDFFICNEYELMLPQATYIFKRNGNVSIWRDGKTHQSVLDERYDELIKVWKIETFNSEGKTHIIATADRKKSGFIRFPFKIMVRSFHGGNWCVDPLPVRVLGKCTTSPGDFGWVK